MDCYENIRVVGRGAYGSVHLCRRRSTGKSVILKEIPIALLSQGEGVEHTLNECRVLSMLKHPNVIQYYENFKTDSAIMIVMEYAPGGTLHDYIVNRHGLLGEEKEVLYLFSQILLGLHHMHSNRIVHRDLKTQNIFLNAAQLIIKIGDFGISKVLSTKTKAGTVVGTPCYMSPELCDGRLYDEKTDLWALGCILYELITSRLAFEAEAFPALILKIMRGSVGPIPEQYSGCLRHLVSSLLHLDPNKRPSTEDLMELPILFNSITNLHTDLGSIACASRCFYQCYYDHVRASSIITEMELKPYAAYFFCTWQ